MAVLVLKMILPAGPEQNATVLEILLGILVSFFHVGIIYLVTMAGHVMAKLVNVAKKMELQNIMALVVICLPHAMAILVKMVVCVPEALLHIILRPVS